MAYRRIKQSEQKALSRDVKACLTERKIREDEAEKLAEHLHRNTVKSVAVCVHCCENETLDEVAVMLSSFSSLPDFSWDAVRHDQTAGIGSYMVVRYASGKGEN
ncbi:hypothetical protein [Caproiciproducens faecalis]|uniref:Uncharacterized protein n=1 Tax=Caproiciproducens faecalis TaxID=2820301 RepID=A0ABS7DLF3_9FIRM|nr:hypothetical protein [Caproiciproducens faecalis]MBW7571949.1 hypothetical protein [Caproiciproducens faecalis]